MLIVSNVCAVVQRVSYVAISHLKHEILHRAHLKYLNMTFLFVGAFISFLELKAVL